MLQIRSNSCSARVKRSNSTFVWDFTTWVSIFSFWVSKLLVDFKVK